MNFLRSLFEYKAIKKVKVRSLKVGLLSFFAFGAVAFYIVVYQLFYKSRHFASAEPRGTGRIQAQRPVKNHCNVLHADCEADFTPREKLHYCSQSEGQHTDNHMMARKFPCEYWDEHMMDRTGFQLGSTLIPTRVTTQRQEPSENCGIHSKGICKNTYTFKDGGNTHHGNTTYIADVERFTLLVDHAFTMPRKAITPGIVSQMVGSPSRIGIVPRGSSTDFAGYWEKCDDPKILKGCVLVRIPCLKDELCDGDSKSHAATLPKESLDVKVPGIIGLTVGDVIPVGTLLSLAGVDLDNDVNSEGEPLRSTGVALQLDIAYENRVPWRLKFWTPGTVHYIYRVTKLPVETYKGTPSTTLANGERILMDTHGLFVFVTVQGDILYFDITQAQLILATLVSLLAVAGAVVNFYAESVWRHGDLYQKSKYDSTVSMDSGDYICCIPVPEDTATTQKNYSGARGKTALEQDLVALDGEALRWAALVMHKVHSTMPQEHQDELQIVRNQSASLSPEKQPEYQPLRGNEGGQIESGS